MNASWYVACLATEEPEGDLHQFWNWVHINLGQTFLEHSNQDELWNSGQKGRRDKFDTVKVFSQPIWKRILIPKVTKLVRWFGWTWFWGCLFCGTVRQRFVYCSTGLSRRFQLTGTFSKTSLNTCYLSYCFSEWWQKPTVDEEIDRRIHLEKYKRNSVSLKKCTCFYVWVEDRVEDTSWNQKHKETGCYSNQTNCKIINFVTFPCLLFFSGPLRQHSLSYSFLLLKKFYQKEGADSSNNCWQTILCSDQAIKVDVCVAFTDLVFWGESDVPFPILTWKCFDLKWWIMICRANRKYMFGLSFWPEDKNYGNLPQRTRCGSFLQGWSEHWEQPR